MTCVSSVEGVKTKTRIRRAAEGQWLNVAIVVVTAILFAVAWPTLQLTHQVSPPIQPFVAALATFPFLLIRSNPRWPGPSPRSRRW